MEALGLTCRWILSSWTGTDTVTSDTEKVKMSELRDLIVEELAAADINHGHKYVPQSTQLEGTKVYNRSCNSVCAQITHRDYEMWRCFRSCPRVSG